MNIINIIGCFLIASIAVVLPVFAGIVIGTILYDCCEYKKSTLTKIILEMDKLLLKVSQFVITIEIILLAIVFCYFL